ncbi:flavin-dependent amine oxidoreductase [Streptomyces sp. TLI_235]|nr:flavin-dependent amine oxidoreductase [Streptomyces sp. TLI_235]
MGSVDVVVVGAGLAGLACARDLVAGGLEVAVLEVAALEASDGVGGRMRTDLVSGFRLDRGFQVFNTSYPQVRRRIDLRALRLHPFTPGFVLAGDRVRRWFVDPTRRPDLAGDLLPGRLAPFRDTVALGLLSARDMVLPAALLRRGRDVSTGAALASAGLSPGTVDGVLRPFLAGVFLEEGLETSGRVFHLVWRSLLRGTLCLPEFGIGAVPEQLAAGLPPGTVRLESPVEELTADGVLLADGTELPAGRTVVATEAPEAARLLPGLAAGPLGDDAVPRGAGLPAGRADAAGGRGRPGAEQRGAVRGGARVFGRRSGPDGDLGARPGPGAAGTGPLAELYRVGTGGWEHLADRAVPYALPAMPAPHPLTRPAALGGGRYVCGTTAAPGRCRALGLRGTGSTGGAGGRGRGGHGGALTRRRANGITHRLPLSRYSAQGVLRQGPRRTAQSLI